MVVAIGNGIRGGGLDGGVDVEECRRVNMKPNHSSSCGFGGFNVLRGRVIRPPNKRAGTYQAERKRCSLVDMGIAGSGA